MIRVTANTNIHVSALAVGGRPMDLLRLANAGKIELAVSDAILDEVAMVLARIFHKGVGKGHALWHNGFA